MKNEPTREAKPNHCCCEALQFAVDIGSITYDEPLQEFRLMRVEGVGGQYLNYCPWCGEGIFSLRAFWIDKRLEYKKDLKYEEVERYWHIIKQNLDHEETLRLIAEEKGEGQEKSKKKKGGT